MKKVFLLGDSVCLHYTPYLEGYLKNKLEIVCKSGRDEALKQINCAVGACGGDSSNVLQFVREKAEKGDLDFDAFVFNCGLHDIERKVTDENIQVTPKEYESNLNEIFKIMKAHSKKCIFITTTPVYEKAHNEQLPNGIKRYNDDVIKYNEIAKSATALCSVPVIDLYSFITKVTDGLYADYAHFNFPTRRLQASFIAGELLAIL